MGPAGILPVSHPESAAAEKTTAAATNILRRLCMISLPPNAVINQPGSALIERPSGEIFLTRSLQRCEFLRAKGVRHAHLAEREARACRARRAAYSGPPRHPHCVRWRRGEPNELACSKRPIVLACAFARRARLQRSALWDRECSGRDSYSRRPSMCPRYIERALNRTQPGL